jgi:PAS domain S-box-containing protein
MAKARILIVEDETIIAMELEDRLKSLGYAIPAMVATGTAAIQKTVETHPDLVLMDIRLKGQMDGIETAAQIQTHYDVPVVYLTAYADEDTLQRAKTTEPFGYLIKPFAEQELHTTIEMALYKHQLYQNLRESEERYRIVAETATDAIVTIDEESKITFVNPAAEQIFGYTQDEMLGQPLTMLMPDHLRPMHQTALKRYLDTSQKHMAWQAVEVSGLHKSGREIPLEISFGEFKKDGQRTFTGIIRDITERVLLEKRLAAIYQLGQELTPLHDKEPIIRRVLETAMGLLKFEIVGYGLIDETAGELEFHYHPLGGMSKEIKARFPLNSEQSIGATVARSGQALNIPDTTQDPRFVHIPDIPDSRSELWVPMKVNGRVIGVLNVQSAEPNYFTSDDQQLLQTLATQAAIALENAHLYTETQCRAQELAALNEAGRAMTSTLKLDVVLARMITKTRTLLEAEDASVLLYEPGDNELVFAAVADPSSKTLVGTRMPISVGIAGWSVQEGLPLLIDDVQGNPHFYDQIDAITGLTTRSLMAVPLVYQKEIIGVVEVINKIHGTFDQHDLELLEALSSTATIAIKNAQLYEAQRE